MFIKDMFFLHEHARKINIWSGFIVLSPYMGPLLGAFIINTQIWQWAFGVYAIETALCFFVIVLFVDETYYDRRAVEPDLITTGPRWQRMLGIHQIRSRYIKNSLKDVVMRPVIIICKPVVFIASIYYMLTFAWVVGINTTLSIMLGPIYGFEAKQLGSASHSWEQGLLRLTCFIGFYYFTPVVATILGEVVGHWLHDLIAKVYARHHEGRLEPEARLFAIWVALPFMVAGLILMGYSLERQYHYMLAALGWGCYVFGIMIVTVAINSYVLDSYPEASGEVAALVNFGRTLGGFIVSYFMVEWAEKQGTIRQMGTMCGILGGASFIALSLQIWGKRLRVWSGPARFKTA